MQDQVYVRLRAALAQALEDEITAKYLCLTDLDRDAKHRRQIIGEVAELLLEPEESDGLLKDARALRSEWSRI